MTKSEAGRKGYEAVIAKYGREFHYKGGYKTASLDLYTNSKGEVGYWAAVADGYHVPRGKKHRYGTPGAVEVTQLQLPGMKKVARSRQPKARAS